MFDWPRRDDNDRVHGSCVVYGPVVIVGVGPFTFPQLSEVKQKFKVTLLVDFFVMVNYCAKTTTVNS